MKDKFELTNKVALITGGGSGIGLGIAAAYIALGAKVAITGRNITKLEAAKLALGDHCFIYVNDVTQKDTHEKLVETIEKEVGPIEIFNYIIKKMIITERCFDKYLCDVIFFTHHF